MNVSGYCCLRICGDRLDFAEINSNVRLQPTHVNRKGESNNCKYGYNKYVEDGWFYELEFTDIQNVNDVIHDFTNDLISYKEYLQEICKKNYVRLWCDIYSDYAQVSISFSSETLKRVSELGIGFDIQVYSHGDIEPEE